MEDHLILIHLLSIQLIQQQVIHKI